MPSYASVSDFQSYTGQTIDPTVGQMLLDMSTSAVDAFCGRTFQLARKTETIYGNGTNVIMLRNRPVQAVYSINIVLPNNSGPLIDVNQVLIDPAIGKITNFSIMTLQTIGISALFPHDIPIAVDYSYGPRGIVYTDQGTATDGTYKTYSFTNKSWFTASPVNVYKNGVLLTKGTDYTIDPVNGRVVLTVAALSTDSITADYWFYQVPADVKLATLMIALKQLTLTKPKNLLVASEGDSDYKVSYNVEGALGAIDTQIAQILAAHKRRGVA